MRDDSLDGEVTNLKTDFQATERVVKKEFVNKEKDGASEFKQQDVQTVFKVEGEK